MMLPTSNLTPAKRFTMLIAGFCLLFTALASAQDVAVKPKALQPEPQTRDWWMPRHEQKLEQKAAMERVDLLMIGDSITHGWENAGKKVWQQYYAKRNALNLGFSADRTEHVLWRLQHGEVAGIQPRLAVLMIGTNNAGHRQDPAEDTAAGVQAIIEELQKRLPETRVLVLAIFPRGAEPDHPLRKLNAETNAILETFADGEHVFFLDISDEFLEDDGTLPKSIMPDLLHPNAAGYAIWAKAQEPMIERLMKR